MTTKPTWDWCFDSGIRTPISVAEERRRETTCPRCGCVLRVRPVREIDGRRDPAGNPVVTLPRHKAPAQSTPDQGLGYMQGRRGL